MDTLTHALSGALIARAATPGRHAFISRGDVMLLGALSAAFPDADVIFSLASPLAYLHLHRGVTHSLVMLPLWAVLLAWIWSRLKRNPRGFKDYLIISALGVGIHIIGDLITSFGTMVLAPMSDARFHWDTTFIIDLWFSGIIVAGLVLSFAFRQSRAPAIAGLLLLCAYVSFQWVQKYQAIEVGHEYAAQQRLDARRVSALPRPVSPFNWMVIVEESDRYHFAFVNLRRERELASEPDAGFIARLDAAYQPVGFARWHVASRFGQPDERTLSEQAFRHADFGFFRWFSAYPVFAAIERGNPVECVWFQDLRFLTPGRTNWPFRYGMCRSPGADWRAYEAKESGGHIPLIH